MATANLGIVYEMPGGHVSFVAKLVWRNTGWIRGLGAEKPTLGMATSMWTAGVERALKLAERHTLAVRIKSQNLNTVQGAGI